jgi:hypothetical protein
MMQLDYGIYRSPLDGPLVWIENVNNLQAARVRATELARKSKQKVSVYDLRNPARALFELEPLP